MNPVKGLQDHGQAVWLDFLSRGFIANGGLKKLVDDDGLRGVTSNPSIFEQAIGRTNEYDDGIQRMLHNEDLRRTYRARQRSRRKSPARRPQRQDRDRQCQARLSALFAAVRRRALARARHARRQAAAAAMGFDRDQEQSL